MQDYHIHSSFSGDSHMSMSDACKKAVSRGLLEIAFTDHIDLDWPGNTTDFKNISLAEYFKSLNKYIDKYSDKIKIKKGIELGLQPHTIEKTSAHITGFDFDYIIASVHCVDNTILDCPVLFNGRPKNSAYLTYFQDVLTMVRNLEKFSVLGHIDVITRYVPDPAERNINYLDFTDIIDDILSELVRRGKGIEVNTSGYRYGLNSFHPGPELVKRFFKLGGEVITVGSDAHTPDYIGHQISSAMEMIRSCGFRYISSFSDMNVSFIKI